MLAAKVSARTLTQSCFVWPLDTTPSNSVIEPQSMCGAASDAASRLCCLSKWLAESAAAAAPHGHAPGQYATGQHGHAPGPYVTCHDGCRQHATAAGA